VILMKNVHILIYSEEFPNPAEPTRGTFVERNLPFFPDYVDIKVIAPIPFLLAKRRGKRNLTIPHKEIKQYGKRETEIYHPRYILFPRNFFRPLIGIFQYLFAFKTIQKINEIWLIDLIHVHFSYPAGAAVRMICERLKLKYIVTEHRGAIDNFLQNRYLRPQIKQTYRQAERIIAVSEFTRKQIQKAGFDNLPVEIIPNGIQIQNFLMSTQKSEPSNLVYIGNLIPTKGIQLLIKALAELKQEGINFQLDIIGDGKYKNVLQRLSKDLNLQNNIHFLGIKTPEEICNLLSSYDILVQPSLLESFSIVLIEAMAAGLPVIATRCGGPEFIVTEQTGILVQPASVKELVSGLKYMKDNWQKYDPIQISGYTAANYDIVLLTQKISTLYLNVTCAEDNNDER